MEGISLLDLPLANIAEVEAGQFAYIVTPDGQPFKVDIADLVEKMATDNNGQRVFAYTEIIQPAAVLTSNTTPITLAIPRAAGETILPLQCVCSISYGTTAYATHTELGIRYIGANRHIYNCDILGRTASGAKYAEIKTTINNTETQILNDTDIEVHTKGGDPTAGDSVVTVSIIYIKQV